MTVESLHDLTDGDAASLAEMLTQIRDLADDLARDGNSRGFQIYKKSRDALEILCFDAQSRETIRKLTNAEPTHFKGYPVDPDVASLIKAGNRVAAVKEFRSCNPNMGLKEAIDWVDAYKVQVLGGPAFV